jgi:hypothetical protein
MGEVTHMAGALDEEDVVPQGAEEEEVAGGQGRYRPPRPDNRPKCQLCGQRGHTVLECWHRFDESYILDEKYAGAATSYGVNSNWYTDTGARNHVTGELEKLTVHDRYRGNDQIHTANGAGMNICRIGLHS